ncbi:MAG: hypothetical protein ABI183_06355 [Polyangiaceae bacterium]
MATYLAALVPCTTRSSAISTLPTPLPPYPSSSCSGGASNAEGLVTVATTTPSTRRSLVNVAPVF